MCNHLVLFGLVAGGLGVGLGLFAGIIVTILEVRDLPPDDSVDGDGK
jgi:hypothetical protein